MWPVLFNRRFLTVVQVDEPKRVVDSTGVHWEVHLLDIAGRVHRALYRHVAGADEAWKAFRSFAVRPRAQRGLCIWLMDHGFDVVEIQEG